MAAEASLEGAGPYSRLTSPGGVARNLLVTVTSQTVSIAVSLITVPIVVHGIGPSAYGIFALAWLLVGYAGLLDFGLTAATIRAIAVQRVLADHESLQRTVSTAMASFVSLALPVGILLFVVSMIGIRLVFHLPPDLENDAAFVFGVVAGAFVVNACLTIFLATMVATQQFRRIAAQAIAVAVSTGIAQIVIVRAGLGLRWLVLASFSIFAVSLVMFIRPSSRSLPGVRFRPHWHAATFRSLITFGSARFTSQILLQLAYGVDRLVLAAALPITAVTYYSVPLSITQKFVVLQTAVGQTFFPSASELHGTKSAEQLRALYLDVIKLAVATTLPIAVLAAGLSWPILAAWLGPGFADHSARILSVLAAGYALIAIVIVPAQVSDATGHVRWTMAFAAVAAAITVLSAIVLVRPMGAVGPAIGVSIGVGLTGLTFAYVVQRWILGLSLRQVVVHAVVRPAVAAAGLAVYCTLISSRVHGIASVVAAGVLGLLLYLTLTVVTSTWTAREISFVRRLLAPRVHRPAAASDEGNPTAGLSSGA